MEATTINADSRLVLKSLRLSSNPAKPVVDMEEGVGGKINMTSDGRGYFIAEFKTQVILLLLHVLVLYNSRKIVWVMLYGVDQILVIYLHG